MNLVLKLAIVASGRTQREVAKRVGMDQWRLSRIIAEDITPRPEERTKIARILRLPVEELFGALEARS